MNGGAGNDILSGLAGQDLLTGGTGADAMYGGLGNDLYNVDNTGDIVIDYSNEGIDTVKSTITYTLSSNVENLTLIGNSAINGTGNELDNVITGNNYNNILSGLAGNDTISGLALNDTIIGGIGNDVLIGGAGNDTYIFNVGDAIDTITDSASSGVGDLIKFGNLVDKNKVAFFKDSSGNFLLDYGNSIGVDKVAVNNWNNTTNQIEKIQLNDGTFITNTDVNTIIQNMTAYATQHSITLTSVEDVKNNSEIMNLYMNNTWHN